MNAYAHSFFRAAITNLCAAVIWYQKHIHFFGFLFVCLFLCTKWDYLDVMHQICESAVREWLICYERIYAFNKPKRKPYFPLSPPLSPPQPLNKAPI